MCKSNRGLFVITLIKFKQIGVYFFFLFFLQRIKLSCNLFFNLQKTISSVRPLSSLQALFRRLFWRCLTLFWTYNWIKSNQIYCSRKLCTLFAIVRKRSNLEPAFNIYLCNTCWSFFFFFFLMIFSMHSDTWELKFEIWNFL